MDYVPKEITEEVNVTPVHPLVNLGHLLTVVLVGSAVVYACAGVVAQQLVHRIDPETETQIGVALTGGLEATIDREDPRVDYLYDLTAQLQAESQAAGFAAPTYPPVNIGILEGEVENAMVTVGSQMLVTEGFLDAVETENELAFVIAHELGHLQERDPVTGLGRGLVWLTLSSLLGLGGQTSGVVGGALNLAESGHSRSQESMADRYALTVMMERYEHGGHSLDFFYRAQEESLDFGVLNTVASWQQTHPYVGDRIQALSNLAETEQFPLEGEPTSLPDDFHSESFSWPRSEHRPSVESDSDE